MKIKITMINGGYHVELYSTSSEKYLPLNDFFILGEEGSIEIDTQKI